MPVVVQPGQRLKPRNAKSVRALRVVFAVLFVGAIVLGSFGISWANRDAAQAAAFAAAPACPPATVPVGNCAGWEQETVSSVEVGRGGTNVQLNRAGQTLWYMNNTWASGLTSGASVSVLVWRNQAQALREPAGEVLYSDDSVRLNRYNDIAVAVCPFGFVALLYLVALDISPLHVRRPRLWLFLTVMDLSAAAGVFTAGATIQDAKSVDTGITVGVIVFASVALVTAGIAVPVQGIRLRRARAVAR